MVLQNSIRSELKKFQKNIIGIQIKDKSYIRSGRQDYLFLLIDFIKINFPKLIWLISKLISLSLGAFTSLSPNQNA